MAVTDTSAAKKCAVCGKDFVVLYQDLWRYKRGMKWMCSWKCLRAYDNKKGEKKVGKPKQLTQEQRDRAVQICIDGGDPLEYLAECGVGSPRNQWQRIRESVKDSDPVLYQKIPNRRWQKKVDTPEGTLADAMTGMKDAADTFFDQCASMGLMVETPEQPKICMPVVYDSMTVREVEGNFGRYRRSDVSGSTYIDFENADGLDTLSFTVEQWRSFRKEQERAAAILGVTL